MEGIDAAVLLNAVANYGPIVIFGIIFVMALRRTLNQMIDMNSKIFQYFMESNSKANENMQNSLITITQSVQKNTDTVLQAKHDILKGELEVLREIERVKIDNAIMNEALSERDRLRKEINDLIEDRDLRKKENEESNKDQNKSAENKDPESE